MKMGLMDQVEALDQTVLSSPLLEVSLEDVVLMLVLDVIRVVVGLQATSREQLLASFAGQSALHAPRHRAIHSAVKTSPFGKEDTYQALNLDAAFELLFVELHLANTLHAMDMFPRVIRTKKVTLCNVVLTTAKGDFEHSSLSPKSNELRHSSSLQRLLVFGQRQLPQLLLLLQVDSVAMAISHTTYKPSQHS